jgi:hypothetical protein
MKPEGALCCPKDAASRPYPVRVESSLHPHVPFLKDQSQYYLIYVQVSQAVIPYIFCEKIICMYLASPQMCVIAVARRLANCAP